MGPTNGTIYIRFKPTMVELAASGSSVAAQCTSGSCIRVYAGWYQSDGRSANVESYVDHLSLFELDEPGRHRYLSAFQRLQSLCGGVQRNPFD